MCVESIRILERRYLCLGIYVKRVELIYIL